MSQEIKRLRDTGIKGEEIAVFYRANAQSRMLEDHLRKERVGYRIVGGIRFYERKEVRDFLAYLRVVFNERDTLSLVRIINVPARGVGATMLRHLEEASSRAQCSLWEALIHFIDNPSTYNFIRTTKRVISSLQEFVALVRELKQMNKEGMRPSSIFEKALYGSGYGDFLRASRDFEAQARLENLGELGNAIREYEQTQEEPTLSGFLERVALETQEDQLGQEDLEKKRQEQVSLMTVHGAKGLEFPYVFVVGVEENVFPSYQGLESGQEAVEEERRLFYVAMTRAMEKLYLVFAKSRMLFGSMKYNGPSRFLDEVPDEYCHRSKATHNRKRVAKERVSSLGRTRRIKDKRATFPKGAPIVHALYGKGIVMGAQGQGGEEKVVVRFIDGEEKKFMVKFAPITRL